MKNYIKYNDGIYRAYKNFYLPSNVNDLRKELNLMDYLEKKLRILKIHYRTCNVEAWDDIEGKVVKREYYIKKIDWKKLLKIHDV